MRFGPSGKASGVKVLIAGLAVLAAMFGLWRVLNTPSRSRVTGLQEQRAPAPALQEKPPLEPPAQATTSQAYSSAARAVLTNTSAANLRQKENATPSGAFSIKIEGEIFIVLRSRETLKLSLVNIDLVDSDSLGKVIESTKSMNEAARSLQREIISGLLDSLGEGHSHGRVAVSDSEGKFNFTISSPPAHKYYISARVIRETGIETEHLLWIVPVKDETQQKIVLSNNNLL